VFNPLRLTLARQRRGLKKVELGREIDLSSKSLGDFEAGRAEPSSETLQRIADRLNFPVEFFFRGAVEVPTAESVAFRSMKSMTAGQRMAALAAGAIAFELCDWIEDEFELPTADLPDLREFAPADAALALRNQWGIGVRPIGNMIHLLESKGIRVFSLDMRNRKVDAYSLWLKGKPFVFLNTMKTAEHSRMDAAHELGHLVMHRHGAFRTGDVEKDAHAFGAAFLMPAPSVYGIVPRLAAPSIEVLAQLKQNWRVSVAALARRLRELELITEWAYRGIYIELSRRGRTKEPQPIERETSQVLAKVFEALKDAGISKSAAAARLGLFTEDIDALTFGLAIGGAATGTPKANVNAVEQRRKLHLVD